MTTDSQPEADALLANSSWRELARRMHVEFEDYHYNLCPANGSSDGICNCFAGLLVRSAGLALRRTAAAPAVAGPVAWRSRANFTPKWEYSEKHPKDFYADPELLRFRTIEPLYATPSPAVAVPGREALAALIYRHTRQQYRHTPNPEPVSFEDAGGISKDCCRACADEILALRASEAPASAAGAVTRDEIAGIISVAMDNVADRAIHGFKGANKLDAELADSSADQILALLASSASGAGERERREALKAHPLLEATETSRHPADWVSDVFKPLPNEEANILHHLIDSGVELDPTTSPPALDAGTVAEIVRQGDAIYDDERNDIQDRRAIRTFVDRIRSLASERGES